MNYKNELMKYIALRSAVFLSLKQQLSAKLAETEAEYRSREEEIKNLQNIIMDLEDNRNCSHALEEEKISNSLSSVESKHKELQTANAFLELKCMGLEMKVKDVHKLKQSIADLQQLLDTAKSEMKRILQSLQRKMIR